MSEKKQGESVSVDMTEAVKSAPSSKGSASSKGSPMEKASDVLASQAPKHKGGKPSHSGVPATDPVSKAAPFDSSKMELDGMKLKKPSKRK